MMISDGVREMRGVWAGEDPTFTARRQWVSARQTQDGVQINIGPDFATMTPAAARELARQLYRQARRFEATP